MKRTGELTFTLIKIWMNEKKMEIVQKNCPKKSPENPKNLQKRVVEKS